MERLSTRFVTTLIELTASAATPGQGRSIASETGSRRWLARLVSSGIAHRAPPLGSHTEEPIQILGMSQIPERNAISTGWCDKDEKETVQAAHAADARPLDGLGKRLATGVHAV